MKMRLFGKNWRLTWPSSGCLTLSLISNLLPSKTSFSIWTLKWVNRSSFKGCVCNEDVLFYSEQLVATSCTLYCRLEYELCCHNKSALMNLNDSYLFLPLQVLVVNAQGDVTRVSTRGKEVVMKGTLSQYFKLGQEGKYRVYHNQYSSNTVALNKHQHREASSTTTCSIWIFRNTLDSGTFWGFSFLCVFARVSPIKVTWI